MHRLDLCLEPAPARCLAAKFEALVRLRESTILLSEQLTSALSLHPACASNFDALFRLRA